MSQFAQDINKFNGIYRLPVNERPTLDYLNQTLDYREAAALRLTEFKDIISEEVNEVDEIIKDLREGGDEMKALTDLADWLGDIQVYCASEMAKFGLPLDKVLEAIMQSNFSKLGADGNPIYDARGKVLKGPNYWKPEPAIMQLLRDAQTVDADFPTA
jgi:predicted HAD superfamily Cof-like phosphohydrolase